MTPAEHYAEAERLLTVARNEAAEHAGKPGVTDLLSLALTEAQVHATLATVNPDVLWPMRAVNGSMPKCTCGHLVTGHGRLGGVCLQNARTCSAFLDASEVTP